MKKYINTKFKNSYFKLFIIIILGFSCTMAHCQDTSEKTSKMISFSMTPHYSEKETDSLKWNIVTLGDESSFSEYQLALWSSSKNNASVMYEEFLQYALIMAFVYEYIPACYYVYTIINRYRQEKGEVLTEKELLLCKKSLSIGAMKGDEECAQLLEQLSKGVDDKGHR